MRFTTYFVIYLLLVYSPLSSAAIFNNFSLKKICNSWKLSDEQCCMADKVIKGLGYGGLAAAVGTYGTPFVLAQLGFTATGIVGGSLAASWQATGIASGLFSWIRSISMTGAAASVVTKIGIASAAVKSYFSPCVILKHHRTLKKPKIVKELTIHFLVS